MVPVVTFVGKSGAGKTTFVEQVVRALKAAGLRVGVAKHTHHLVEFDQPGKDSWRFAQAGGDVVVLGTPRGFTLFDRAGEEVGLLDIARQLDGRVDIVIAEGYKTAPVPKIAVVRRAVSSELPCAPADLIALVTDVAWETAAPRFTFQQTEEVASFLKGYFHLSPGGPRPAMSAPVPISAGGAATEERHANA
jgi:molybdopterin-guanine dinucleotide biosynthesis protein B